MIKRVLSLVLSLMLILLLMPTTISAWDGGNGFCYDALPDCEIKYYQEVKIALEKLGGIIDLRCQEDWDMPYNAGDANHDGKISISDALLIAQYKAGIGDYDPLMDADWSGEVKMADAMFIAQLLVSPYYNYCCPHVDDCYCADAPLSVYLALRELEDAKNKVIILTGHGVTDVNLGLGGIGAIPFIDQNGDYRARSLDNIICSKIMENRAPFKFIILFSCAVIDHEKANFWFNILGGENSVMLTPVDKRACLEFMACHSDWTIYDAMRDYGGQEWVDAYFWGNHDLKCNEIFS